MIEIPKNGDSPSGKAVGSGPTIRGFESLIPSHNEFYDHYLIVIFYFQRFAIFWSACSFVFRLVANPYSSITCNNSGAICLRMGVRFFGCGK